MDEIIRKKVRQKEIRPKKGVELLDEYMNALKEYTYYNFRESYVDPDETPDSGVKAKAKTKTSTKTASGAGTKAKRTGKGERRNGR